MLDRPSIIESLQDQGPLPKWRPSTEWILFFNSNKRDPRLSPWLRTRMFYCLW